MSKTQTEKRVSSSEGGSDVGRQIERRHHPRFAFTASVDMIEPRSHAKVSGRTSDLCLGGCYIDTINPFGVGTLIKIRLTKDKATFEADAKVIFSHVGMGMGVAFISAMPRQVRIFQKWLIELAEKSLPKLKPAKEPEVNIYIANLTKRSVFVLDELLSALMKQGVLSDEEGNAMIQQLRH